MLKKHGILGLLFIIYAEVIMLLKIQPLSTWYFYPIWFGYILFVDSLVYEIKKKSIIINEPIKAIKMLFISIFVWWFFEFCNLFTRNWYYKNIQEPIWLIFSIAFSTVILAVFETSYLLKSLKIFERIKLPFEIKITKNLIFIIVIFGLLLMLGVIVSPYYFFGGIWFFPFLILDPINYIKKRPSILKNLEKGKFNEILYIMIATLICGFFWEFWNFWAYPKWFYNIPLLHNLGFLTPITTFKIFEMYLPGYLGYMPFGLSLFAMYYFAEGIIRKIKSS